MKQYEHTKVAVCGQDLHGLTVEIKNMYMALKRGTKR